MKIMQTNNSKSKFLALVAAMLLCCGGAFSQNDTVRSFWKSDYRNGVSICYSYKNTAPQAISVNYRHDWYGVGVEFNNSTYKRIDLHELSINAEKSASLNLSNYTISSINLAVQSSDRLVLSESFGHLLIVPQLHTKYISIGLGIGFSRGQIYYGDYSHYHFQHEDFDYSVDPPIAVEDESRRINTSNDEFTQSPIQYLFHLKPSFALHLPIGQWQFSATAGYSIIPQKNKTENQALAKCDGFSFGLGIGYMW